MELAHARRLALRETSPQATDLLHHAGQLAETSFEARLVRGQGRLESARVSLENPRNLVEASHDLGASRLQTFRRVILPLSIPGVLAGATFAFVLSFGDFLAPLLLGGPSGIMISNVVVSLFGAAFDWPLGAAISLCMLVLIVTLLSTTERLEKRWGRA